MKRIKTLACLTGAAVLLSLTAGCSKSSREAITVVPVENLSEDFMLGMDVSSMISLEESGVSFYNQKGKKNDVLKILKEGGTNAVRIRVWNNPFDKDGNPYGAGNNDIETAVRISRRAKDQGLKVLIDFHYSDFWADPNKHRSPKAWEGMSLEERAAALSEYTTDCLKKIKEEAGVIPAMVQVGNEINNGLAGVSNDDEVCTLLNAGCNAVRSFDPSILIAVHYTDPNQEGYLRKKAEMLKKHHIDYDVFGTSYYPFWHGSLDNLTMVLKQVSNIYGKKVYVAETSYAFTNEDGDGYGNIVTLDNKSQTHDYPFTVEGQAIAVRDVVDAVSKVKDGIGVFYWEGAWVPVRHYNPSADNAKEVLAYNQNAWETKGSGWATSFAKEYDPEVTDNKNGGTWDNQALFDFDGKALESINVYRYCRTGSKGKKNVLRVENPKLELNYGKGGELPATVKVTYNDYSVEDVAVEWDKALKEKLEKGADFGEYLIGGKTKDGTSVTLKVSVIAKNCLSNGDFEKGNEEDWTIVNPQGKGAPKVDKNDNNAKSGSYYFTGWAQDDFDFTIGQKVTDLVPGIYACYASFQGTGVKNPSGTKLTVTITSKDGTTKSFDKDVTVPNVWKNFYKAEIDDLNVDQNTASVTVSVKMAASFNGSGNGAWLVCDDVNLLFVK